MSADDNAHAAASRRERQALERACARAIAFRETAATRPPRPTASLAELRASLGGPTPESGEDWAALIDALADAAEPGLMGMAGPHFFGFVIGASHPAGVAADWLTSAWGQNAGLYVSTPAAAVAEETAGRWILDLVGLPASASVGFTTGATMANFTALAAARDEVLRRVGWDVSERGLQGAPVVRVLLGEEAHTTVFKALHYLGFGIATLTRIPADAQGRMQADALERALLQGRGPAIVVAQAGHVSTGAFDPVGAIAAASRAAGAWLHVDGAFGLWARACPDRAYLASGVEEADSWSTDAHKWLQVPYDCGVAIVADRAVHRRAMAIGASYLPEDEETFDPSHYVPELSRRARGFAVWAMLRALGREGVAEIVSRHCALARRAAERLSVEPGIEVLNDVFLNQIVVGFAAGEPVALQSEAARAVIARVQSRNRVFIGGGVVGTTKGGRGRWIARISIIAHATSEADVDLLVEEIVAAWRAARPDDRQAASAAAYPS
jgi:glutamate/tyrosine decarboxylase-like PLP-dependent enzyme